MRKFLISTCTVLMLSFFCKSQVPASAFKKGIAVGEFAPDFVSTTPDGDQLALSDLVKKYKFVLIDFWASWCLPCRKEIPNIRAVYDRFNDIGFTVLSISEDFNSVDWNKAIYKDTIKWYNVSSLQGREEPIAKLYKINAIPAAILVDSTLRIISIDAPGSGYSSNDGSLRGRQLYLRIEELLGKRED